MDSYEALSDLSAFGDHKARSDSTRQIDMAPGQARTILPPPEDESMLSEEANYDEDDLNSSMNSESTGIRSDQFQEGSVASSLAGKYLSKPQETQHTGLGLTLFL